MDEKPYQKEIEKHFGFLFDEGFAYEYLYDKGSDSSCVYICRYQKGKSYFDWRENSGGKEINIVVCVNGAFRFPSLKSLYSKEHRAFAIKHIFKKASVEDRREFIATLLNAELLSGKPDFFGIPL